MPSPLAANINNGVLIDMSMFKGVNYNAANSLAIVGAGQRWGDVYNQLDPYNVTVVGGRVLDVGVGGLTLGCESVQCHFAIFYILKEQVDCHISQISMVWSVIMSSTLRFSPKLRE